MQSFEESYKSLNKEQKEAVDYIDGPLLVVAGPGTGKTQLLSLRAAQILLKTDTDPSNILCLTYTNKASINMKERLLALIGPEANKINVKTFHSFANDIIDSYPEYFWNGAYLKPIPETRQLEIIENILSSLPLDNPLAMKFSGKYTQVKPVIDAINLSKEAGLTPQKLRTIILSNVAYIDEIESTLVDILDVRLTEKQYPSIIEKIDSLEEMQIDESLAPLKALDVMLKDSFHHAVNEKLAGKSKAVSSWKTKWIQTINGEKGMFSERRHNSWWLNFCDVYEDYQRISQDLGFMDIADIIIEAILALETHADLRANVQEKYSYVMIDEFQDTNLAQGRLSRLVAEHHTNEGHPNIMAVGDDDQTIYRFQGAELNNMREFVDMYSAKIIVLTNNYRSTQAILDASKKVIEHAESRLINLMDGLSKNLVSVNNTSSDIQHFTYTTDNHQYSKIVEIVKKYSEQGSVAVLARYNNSLTAAVPFFKERGVDVNFEQQRNLFDDDIVNLLIQIMGAINYLYQGDKSNADSIISELIRHEIWGIEPIDLWNLAILNRRKKSWLISMIENDNENIRDIGNWLLWLSTFANREPATISLEYIVGLKEGNNFTSPIFNYIKKKEIILESLSAVNKFVQMGYEYGGGRSSIIEFYNVICRLISNEKPVHDENIYKAKDTNIHFLTVHKSKGLEFDTVLILDATEKDWSPSNSRTKRTPPINLPLQKSGDNMDDYARLMYVAMTRARKNIIVTNFKIDNNNKEHLESILLSDFNEAKIINPPDEAEAVDLIKTKLSWPRLKPSDELELLRERLEEYQLSATDLTTFLNVAEGGPQNFFETKLLRLPSPKISAFSFGTAMHTAMEAGQKNSFRDTFDLNNVIDNFQQALANEPMTQIEYERYFKHGNELLNRLFIEHNFEYDKYALAEEKINVIYTDGARLTGTIDVLHHNNKSVWFDDYKTGEPLRSLDSKHKTDAEKKWRIRTQIIFYYILLNSSKLTKGKSIDRANLIYLEAEHKKDMILSYNPNDDEINDLSRVIPKVWEHIQKLNFPDTSHYSSDYDGINKFTKDLIDGLI